jgi:hypothetical protein
VGNNRVLIGAFSDDAGASAAGAAHLFTLESFTPGLVAAGVRDGAITSASIAAGAVTSHQLAADAVGESQLADGTVTTSALADGAVTANKLDTISDWFPLTIANPTPAPVEGFASSVAGLGNGRVIIGASADDAGNGVGAAYLFSTKGTLLTTITNPTPEQFDAFGRSVAAVGTDRILVGAPQDNTGAGDAGSAYLFNTNGTRVATFLNPTPGAFENFGESVAAVGNNHVLIGSPNDQPGTPAPLGAAYLFSTGGLLVNTFTNPTPSHDAFGISVAALGNNRVLIGASHDDAGATNAGVAHLFHTNGTLLMTFTNPAPTDGALFGYSVAALGNDRVLIGAFGDDTGANLTGAAYLFSTNGILLTTFTNPTPEDFENFGISVAAVGGDRVLIGAGFDNTGADSAGAAYLFSTNGILLTTLTNPAPEANDQFGRAVAAVGTNQVLIGANSDNVLGPDAGAAYLFKLESFSPGVIADGVRGTAIKSEDLADGAVTATKLDPTIGVWTRSGTNVYRAAGYVGIRTTTPQSALHVAGDAAFFDNPGGAIRVARTAGQTSNDDLGIWNRGGSGGQPFALADWNTGTRGVFVNTASGNVGIGTSTPGFRLEVNGTAHRVDNASTWTVVSDARLKQKIRPLPGALDKLLALRGVNFEYIDSDKAPALSGEQIGFIAQEVERVFPDWVETGADGYKRVTVRGLEALVVEALRELQQRQDARLVEELKRRDAENAELKRSVEELKSLVNGLARKLSEGAQ